MTKLKQIRKDKGLKLREVAEILHVRTETVGRMETIGIKKPETAQKYAPAFPGCTWQDLIEDPKIKESFK